MFYFLVIPFLGYAAGVLWAGYHYGLVFAPLLSVALLISVPYVARGMISHYQVKSVLMYPVISVLMLGTAGLLALNFLL